MSVSITTPPNALTPIGNGFKFKLAISDLGTLPEIKRAAWILEDGSGGEIVPISSTRPGSTGDAIPLDFEKDIRGLVSTKLPAIAALGVQNDSTFIKEFKLKYGDVTINTETGAVTEAVTNLSSGYKVFNGANNIWDPSLITAAGIYILSYRPKSYNLLRGSLDYLWILGSTSVVYTVYYSNGTTQTITQSAPYDANIVPVGLPFLDALLTGDASDVNALRIVINGVTYNVGFENICEDSQDFLEVLFLEPPGGRSVMLFQTIDGAGVDKTSTTANIIKSKNNIADLRNSGNSIIHSEAYGTYSLRRQIGSDPDEIRWAQGFRAANEHHVLIKDTAGTRFWAKCECTNANLDYQGKEITANLKHLVPIDAPYVM